MKQSDSIGQIIEKYKLLVDQTIAVNIEKLGSKSKLRDVCEYALKNGGKRFRPALVFMIAEALDQNVDVTNAALAIEYFHTSSLIADDLPCMDDDDMRRNKPSVHKVYGESTALLASYALIAAGYECIANNARQIENGASICLLALENSTYNTGLNGATGGQYLDVFPPNLSIEVVREVICKKTVSLFEISFVFGWLFGGGNLDKLDDVKTAAYHFGMAFQIADDIGDTKQDLENGRKINIANIIGIDESVKMFHEEKDLFLEMLKKIELQCLSLRQLATVLTKEVEGNLLNV